MNRVVAVVGILGLCVLCFGVWWVQTDKVLDHVEVHTARPVCAGTSLDGDHTIRAQRGMSCTVTVTVANTSSRPVHVDQVLLPMFGPQARWVLEAGRSTAQQLEDHGVDAVLPIDEDLDSGDLLQFGVDVAFRDAGCTTRRGDVDWVQPWPRVSISFLGHSKEQTGDGELRFSQVQAARGCPTR